MLFGMLKFPFPILSPSPLYFTRDAYLVKNDIEKNLELCDQYKEDEHLAYFRKVSMAMVLTADTAKFVSPSL